MKFKDLLRLRRDRSGQIPESTLRKLTLPVPEGVFEQFVRDHATTPFTQRCYGELDLHAIRWDEVRLSASTISTAAVHEQGKELVRNLEQQAAMVAAAGWRNMPLSKESVTRWAQKRTWIALPLFVEGSLVQSSATMQLIEGHCRLGTLRGLLRCAWLAPESTHAVWLGRKQRPRYSEGGWKEIVRREGITFVDWINNLPLRGGQTDEISRQVLNATCAKLLNRHDEPSVVYDLVKGHPKLKGLTKTLRALEDEWREYTNP